MKRNFNWRRTGCGAAATACLLTGCTRAPTFDILGSLFPAWLVCLGLGMVLTFFARWALARWKVALVYPILVYPSLAALFTFLLWLLLFG
jgi:hypothetical protein